MVLPWLSFLLCCDFPVYNAEMESGTGSKDAGAEAELGKIISNFESMQKVFELCVYYGWTYYNCV